MSVPASLPFGGTVLRPLPSFRSNPCSALLINVPFTDIFSFSVSLTTWGDCLPINYLYPGPSYRSTLGKTKQRKYIMSLFYHWGWWVQKLTVITFPWASEEADGELKGEIRKDGLPSIFWHGLTRRHWFLNWDLRWCWTSSSNITWELAGNANPQSSPSLTNQKSCQQPVFSQAIQEILIYAKS